MCSSNSGLGTLSYTYDALGNITSISKDGVLQVSYTYDNLNQLKSSTRNGVTTNYSYDDGGNLISRSGGDKSGSYSYANDKLVSAYIYTYNDGQGSSSASYSISYDTIGNPLSYLGNTFTWTNGRYLATVTNGTNSYSYAYDADGKRVSKTVNGVTTKFHYDGDTLIGQNTVNGADITFLRDATGTIYGLQQGSNLYYFAFNVQGDVIGIYSANGTVIATYEYDDWGVCTVNILASDSAGNSITSANHIANINPIRYRGYYYDAETNFYFLQSRYYDPTVCRFINADGYVSTGQGVLGTNMFAYCGNNPVNRVDPTGQFWITALIVTAVAVVCTVALSGCSAKPKPEPYKSADDAAKAFSEQVYSSSSYIRHEYSTEIYSRTINGETTYNYNPPRAGNPHSASVGNSTPKGTKTVAYAHTHPNSNVFSGADIRAAENLKIDAYVVGPNLELQRYSLSSASTTNLGVISPIALTDAQRSSLVTEFQVSWDAHIADGCDFNCGSMVWPTT